MFIEIKQRISQVCLHPSICTIPQAGELRAISKKNFWYALGAVKSAIDSVAICYVANHSVLAHFRNYIS